MRCAPLITTLLWYGACMAENNIETKNALDSLARALKNIAKPTELCLKLDSVALSPIKKISNTYGAALMLQVDQNGLMRVSKIHSVKQLHVTIGYIQMTDQEELKKALQIGKIILEQELKQDLIPGKANYNFCTEKCEPKFGHITAFIPTKQTESLLKKLNLTLEKGLCNKGITLNPQTKSTSYTPHMTLATSVLDNNTIDMINKALENA